jgi:hypothetical protein
VWVTQLKTKKQGKHQKRTTDNKNTAPESLTQGDRSMCANIYRRFLQDPKFGQSYQHHHSTGDHRAKQF